MTYWWQAYIPPWSQHRHQTQQEVQQHQQNSSTVPISLAVEQQGERGLSTSSENPARQEAKRLRNRAKRARRRQRRKAQAKIGVLQARLATAETELERAQATISSREKSLETARSRLDQTNECLEKSEAALKQEKEQHRGALVDYNVVHGRLEETNAALGQERELRAAAEERNSQWKKDFNELAEQVATERPATQEKLTDDYLVAEVKKLDFHIKMFAQRYFGDESLHGTTSNFDITVATSQADVDEVAVLRTLPGGCFRVAQARLWSILVHSVFGRFVWCLDHKEQSLGGAIREAETCMMALIQGSDPDKTQLDAEHKFHDWKAHVTSHYLQSSRTDDGAVSSSEELNSTLLNAAYAWLGPQQRRSIDHAAFARTLSRILDESLKIDKEISRQPTSVAWVLPAMSKHFNFNPTWMEDVDGEPTDLSRRAVLACVSPGLLRRGTCSGGDFGNERVILPMGVSGGTVTLVHDIEPGPRLGGSIPAEIQGAVDPDLEKHR
ncbi:hypothetical protein RB595_002439 [Gaeumannomyces hyphopodioides]